MAGFRTLVQDHVVSQGDHMTSGRDNENCYHWAGTIAGEGLESKSFTLNGGPYGQDRGAIDHDRFHGNDELHVPRDDRNETHTTKARMTRPTTSAPNPGI